VVGAGYCSSSLVAGRSEQRLAQVQRPFVQSSKLSSLVSHIHRTDRFVHRADLRLGHLGRQVLDLDVVETEKDTKHHHDLKHGKLAPQAHVPPATPGEEQGPGLALLVAGLQEAVRIEGRRLLIEIRIAADKTRREPQKVPLCSPKHTYAQSARRNLLRKHVNQLTRHNVSGGQRDAVLGQHLAEKEARRPQAEHLVDHGGPEGQALQVIEGGKLLALDLLTEPVCTTLSGSAESIPGSPAEERLPTRAGLQASSHMHQLSTAKVLVKEANTNAKISAAVSSRSNGLPCSFAACRRPSRTQVGPLSSSPGLVARRSWRSTSSLVTASTSRQAVSFLLGERNDPSRLTRLFSGSCRLHRGRAAELNS
jgi:hypothetical protein